jgi:outer membrane protein TolC
MIDEKWGLAFPTVSASLNASRMYQLGAGARKDQTSGPMPPANTPVTWGALESMFSTFTGSMELPYYTSSLSLYQPLFTFGKIGTAVTVAREIDSSNQLSNVHNIKQLQLRALDAFYLVVISDVALAVSQRSLDRKKELSEFLARNFSLGTGNKANLLATQADLNSQYAATISATYNARNARMLLSMLMGRAMTDSLKLDTLLSIPTLTSQNLLPETEAIKTAMDKREDLKAMDFLTEANEGGAKIYNAMYLPSIGLQASLGTGGSEAKDLVDWDKRNWLVGVGMQWTLFDGLQNRARARQFISDANKLKIAHETIGKMIEIEVKTALSACAAADSNLVAAGKMLASAREGYDITNENFKQGSGQFSDLQLAEERLRQAEFMNVSARYQLVRSRAALRIAMGYDIITLEDK